MGYLIRGENRALFLKYQQNFNSISFFKVVPGENDWQCLLKKRERINKVNLENYTIINTYG